MYGEAAFKLSANLNHGWNFPTGGLASGSGTIGFEASGDLEARSIAYYKDELRALASPLAAASELRGFILPRSIGDVRIMSPGESFALRGSGTLALNLGLGVPLLVANPISAISYSVVLNAGLRTVLTGTVDVQLVRLGGDQVVVDVGIEKVQSSSATLAIDDSWGVQGLLERTINVAGKSVDLGKLVDKALQKQLNNHVNLISARLSKSGASMRLSVARLRFDLSQLAEASAAAKAFEQALKADVRLAQALANLGDSPGVVAEFDLSRSGVSSASYAGIDIFGLSFFASRFAAEGQVVVQTPGGARTVLFDTLHKESGFFFDKHGYTRVGLSGLLFDGASTPTGEANLFFQVANGSTFMRSDATLDHLDALITRFGGESAMQAIEGPANELRRYAQLFCENPAQANRSCQQTAIADGQVAALKAAAAEALRAAIVSLDPATQDLVQSLGTLKLALASTPEVPTELDEPSGSVVLDYRLDDGMLSELFTQRTGYDLTNALLTFLRLSEVDRAASPQQIADVRAALTQDSARSGALANMASLFDEYAARYRQYRSTELAFIERIGEVGPRALEIRYAVDGAGAPDYASASARSFSQARAQVATQMVDALIIAAKKLGPYPEQSLAYGLLFMTPPERTDVRITASLDTADSLKRDNRLFRDAGWTSLARYFRGGLVAPIDGGMFNVDSLIDVR